MSHTLLKNKILAPVGILLVMGISLLVVPRYVSYAFLPGAQHPRQAGGQAQWTQYLGSDLHQGLNPDETYLSASNIASLKQAWVFHSSGNLAAEPVVANGVLYEGDWNGGMFALNDSTGQLMWQTQLSVDTTTHCGNYRRGVSGAAIVDNGVVYVGSGRVYYALSASDGSILWQQTLGTTGTDADTIYDSAALGNGKIYIGIASLCDGPNTPGMLYALNSGDGSIAAQFATVPNGDVGGPIWGAPTFDSATGTVIVTTGQVLFGKVKGKAYNDTVLELDGNTLALKQSWQVPSSQQSHETDFGCAPTLFPGPAGQSYFGCINKNSIYYVFDEAHLSAGPVWEVQLGPGGERGGITGSMASASYENGVLYIETALATVSGTSYAGSVGAFDALTGQELWRFGTAGPISSTVILANGLLYDTQGSTLEVRNVNSGNTLYSHSFSGPLKGSVTVCNGIVYIPSMNWLLYAFTV
jgi:outer membrane protein assembly factor BamB